MSAFPSSSAADDYGVRVRICVLGGCRVLDDTGAELDLGSRKPRSVVAALALTPGRPVSADALADLVWGGEPPRTAQGSLHAYLSGLRRVLEPGAAGPRRRLGHRDHRPRLRPAGAGHVGRRARVRRGGTRDRSRAGAAGVAVRHGPRTRLADARGGRGRGRPPRRRARDVGGGAVRRPARPPRRPGRAVVARAAARRWRGGPVAGPAGGRRPRRGAGDHGVGHRAAPAARGVVGHPRPGPGPRRTAGRRPRGAPDGTDHAGRGARHRPRPAAASTGVGGAPPVAGDRAHPVGAGIPARGCAHPVAAGRRTVARCGPGRSRRRAGGADRAARRGSRGPLRLGPGRGGARHRQDPPRRGPGGAGPSARLHRRRRPVLAGRRGAAAVAVAFGARDPRELHRRGGARRRRADAGPDRVRPLERHRAPGGRRGHDDPAAGRARGPALGRRGHPAHAGPPAGHRPRRTPRCAWSAPGAPSPNRPEPWPWWRSPSPAGTRLASTSPASTARAPPPSSTAWPPTCRCRWSTPGTPARAGTRSSSWSWPGSVRATPTTCRPRSATW